MRLTSEQTKRIMECVAKEMGVELGDKILIEDGYGGMAEVIVDSGGLLNKAGNPIQTIMPLLRGAESFEKAPWEPKMGRGYYAPSIFSDNGTIFVTWEGDPADINCKKGSASTAPKRKPLQKPGNWGGRSE